MPQWGYAVVGFLTVSLLNACGSATPPLLQGTIKVDQAANPESTIPGPESRVLGDLRSGAFVTLRVRGVLRGCIGYPEPDLPLVDVVERCAVSAAISDPRFPPVSVAEWNDVDLELSVLGPIEPVDRIEDVVIGRDGLIVEFGRRRGLLLPQVAVEWKWDAAEFAAQTCIKAGLPRDAWQKGAKLFKFEAEVFTGE
jgi:AmmeMemoRadiSam system protein A